MSRYDLHDLLQPLRAMATPATGRLVRRNWHYHFARAFNEELCSWTDGAVLQGHDPNGPGRDRQVHWQHLEPRQIWAELQNRIRHNRQIGPLCEQRVQQVDWAGRNATAGELDTACPKCLDSKHSDQTFSRWKRPRLVDQFGEVNLAPTSIGPRISQPGP